jgi:hypothetical protein
MTPEELERLVSDRLRALPAPHAPVTLERRIRTAVAANRPVVRPWSIWPDVWRAAFALGAVVIAASAAAIGWTAAADADGAAWWQIGIRAVAGTTNAIRSTGDVTSFGLASFGSFLASPAVIAVVASIVGAALAFAGLGTWLRHVARSSLAWSSKGASR